MGCYSITRWIAAQNSFIHPGGDKHCETRPRPCRSLPLTAAMDQTRTGWYIGPTRQVKSKSINLFCTLFSFCLYITVLASQIVCACEWNAFSPAAYTSHIPSPPISRKDFKVFALEQRYQNLKRCNYILNMDRGSVPFNHEVSGA